MDLKRNDYDRDKTFEQELDEFRERAKAKKWDERVRKVFEKELRRFNRQVRSRAEDDDDDTAAAAGDYDFFAFKFHLLFPPFAL